LNGNTLCINFNFKPSYSRLHHTVNIANISVSLGVLVSHIKHMQIGKILASNSVSKHSENIKQCSCRKLSVFDYTETEQDKCNNFFGENYNK